MSILQVLIAMVCTISVQWLSLLGHIGTVSFEKATLRMEKGINSMMSNVLKKGTVRFVNSDLLCTTTISTTII